MSKCLKKAIVISTIIIVIIIAIISTFFIVEYIKNKNQINNVIKSYQDENIQKKLEKQDISKNEGNDILLKINDKGVVGVIEIEKLGFESLIYEGTSLEILEKGVGHFESSKHFEGNVCLAAHNTNEYWAKLHTLKAGDRIIYTSFLGKKEYRVTNMVEINENDWTLLKDTEQNILTLITCVKGKRDKRLCVQALEVN